MRKVAGRRTPHAQHISRNRAGSDLASRCANTPRRPYRRSLTRSVADETHPRGVVCERRYSPICGRVRTSGATTSERSSPRIGLSLGRSVLAPGSSRKTILTWHFGPRSVPLRRSVPSSWLSSTRCRLMPGNGLREFRRWEGSSNRPCSPMQSGRTSSKSQASRARCTRERDLKMGHESPHSMRGFMTSHIFHENAWPSSLSGQARPFL